MHRRLFLAAVTAAALAGCSQSAAPVASPAPAEESPPPAGARLVSLKLPGMT